MTDTTPLTPFLSAAELHGDLEDWGPLAEATGDPMTTSGVTTWAHGDLEVGVSAVFPLGWAGTWQIHETIRKLYVLF